MTARRFASEFWAPAFVALVSLSAWWAHGEQSVHLTVVPLARTTALCWAMWGGMLLERRGRIERMMTGWLLCLFAIAATGAVLWPQTFLRTGLEVVLLLWAGVEYGSRLGRWAPLLLVGLPALFCGVHYAAVDMMLLKRVGWLSVLSGPLSPLTGDSLSELLAVVVYTVPVAVAAGGRAAFPQFVSNSMGMEHEA